MFGKRIKIALALLMVFTLDISGLASRQKLGFTAASPARRGRGSDSDSDSDSTDAISKTESDDSSTKTESTESDSSTESEETSDGRQISNRQCNPCPDEMKMHWRDPHVLWICGAYQRARRSFKSLCMMHYRNCQDGTMFVKIHDNRCNNDTYHGDHFFYDYKG